MRPLVSIVTLNWNQAEVTCDLLHSLSCATYPRIEVIVVDNGSDPRDVAKLSRVFPRPRIVRSRENLGFTGGNNLGMRVARGEYVLLLNNDVEVDPGFLEPLVAAMEAMDAAERPDAVLMDLEMPGMDGVAATAAVRQRWPEVTVVVLTVFDDDRRIGAALAAGAAGYLLKDEPADAIVGALVRAVRGEAPVSGGVARVLVERVRQQEQARQASEAALAAYRLTPREREVLVLLATGASDDEMADRLFLSPHTVQSHTKNLYRKLGVGSRAAATRIAATHGLT